MTYIMFGAPDYWLTDKNPSPSHDRRSRLLVNRQKSLSKLWPGKIAPAFYPLEGKFVCGHLSMPISHSPPIWRK